MVEPTERSPTEGGPTVAVKPRAPWRVSPAQNTLKPRSIRPDTNGTPPIMDANS